MSKAEFNIRRNQMISSKPFFMSIWGNIAKSIATDVNEWDTFDELKEKLKNGADMLILQYKENNLRLGGKDGLSIEEYTKEQDKLISSVLDNFKKMALPITEEEPKARNLVKRSKSLFKKNRISPVSQTEAKETKEDDEDGRRKKRKKRSKRRSKKRSKKR